MGMYTLAEALRIKQRNASPDKPRRPRGTGRVSRNKKAAAWLATMEGTPGFIPIRTISEANTREHWAVKAKRANGQRTAAKAATHDGHYTGHFPCTGLRVTLTRYGVRLLDSDNLARSFKAIRDGVADAYGVDDGDSRWEWVYKQQTAPGYGVRIEIEALT